MDPVIVASIICITLFTLFGAFSLVNKSGNPRANRILGIFFLLWSFDFLDGIFLINGYYYDHPDFALWGDSIVFLYGPLLYLYTCEITRVKLKVNFKIFLHFLPFVLFLCSIALLFHRLPSDSKSGILREMLSNYTPIQAAPMIVIAYAHIITYILLSKRQVNKTTIDLNNFYSNHDISWLNSLLNAFLIILSLSIFTDIFHFFYPDSYLNIALPITIFTMGVVIAGIMIKAMSRPVPWQHPLENEKSRVSDLTDSESQKIVELIYEVFDKEKPFLDPEFNLDDLSNRLSFNRRKVSQVINTRLKRNFFDLVNGYRIDTAKEIFTKNEDPNLTVLEVMFDVGFSSKSSFNTQFKKRTGLTPTEFMNLN